MQCACINGTPIFDVTLHTSNFAIGLDSSSAFLFPGFGASSEVVLLLLLLPLPLPLALRQGIGEKIASEWAEARLPHHIRKLSEFMDEKDDDDDDRSHRQHNHILGVLY